MALWYLHRREEPGLLPLDREGFCRAIRARFSRAEELSGDDETRADVHLDAEFDRHTRVTWVSGIITIEANEVDAAVVACAMRQALPDDVSLQWVYEGGSPSTRVLPGDDPGTVLARSWGS